MKNPYTEYTEETQSFTEYFSVCLRVISVKLCVQNGGFFNSLPGRKLLKTRIEEAL